MAAAQLLAAAPPAALLAPAAGKVKTNLTTSSQSLSFHSGAYFGSRTPVSHDGLRSAGQPVSDVRTVRRGVARSVLRRTLGGGSLLLVLGSAEGGKQPWDLGRFLQTVFYFNEPPSFEKVVGAVMARLTGGASEQAAPKAGPAGVVLVVGATGGVGKRVVDVLKRNGMPVRALVRNVDKARKLLGPDVELVTADLTQRQTLLPEYFQGVTRVVNCAAVLVGPKEGDTADRQKYYQGIKFFDPEIKGDTPESVEYRGMLNLIDALKPRLGLREGRRLFSEEANGLPGGPAWGALDDVVMGGVSESSLQIDPRGGEEGGAVGVFRGVVSTSNNGGFASVRSKNFSPLENLSDYEGLELRVKGDGHRFKLIVRTTTDWDAIGYTTSFDTAAGEWQTVRLPFSSFVPVFRARTVPDAAPLDKASIASLQLMYSKFEYDGKLNPSFDAGPFELPVAYVKAYLQEPITPRFVHVGSAGVTRPDRPGLDLSKQPPAVRMNKELGGILTYKLKGEDVLRESGIPFTVVRPCALTEEPAGAELQFEQGDNITGKIGREEVAQILVAALESPAATDKTFEVKSTVPFSQPFTVDPANPPPPTDYTPFFESLQEGITGKEALENVPVAA